MIRKYISVWIGQYIARIVREPFVDWYRCIVRIAGHIV